MSHFAVMVIGDNVEEQLAPYDENIEVEPYFSREVSEKDKQWVVDYARGKGDYNLSSFEECYAKYGKEWNNNEYQKDVDGIWKERTTYNPKSKWDWWQIGGRFSGNFITHLTKEGEAELSEENYGTPSWIANKVGVDSIKKGYIDFDAIRKEAEYEARKKYRNVASFFEGGEIPKVEFTWKDVLEQFKDKTLEERRNIYNSQENVKLWEDIVKWDRESPTPILNFSDNIDKYQIGEDEFVRQAGDASFVPFAVVKNGEWHERGNMGWWAIVTNEKKADDWNAIVKKLLDETDDDELITIVDCHI